MGFHVVKKAANSPEKMQVPPPRAAPPLNREVIYVEIPSRRQTNKVQCYEPATMKYLGYFPTLKPDEVGV
nr:aldehyde dehydrogenase 22A1 [Tanacetum cinerariifolium]